MKGTTRYTWRGEKRLKVSRILSMWLKYFSVFWCGKPWLHAHSPGASAIEGQAGLRAYIVVSIEGQAGLRARAGAYIVVSIEGQAGLRACMGGGI